MLKGRWVVISDEGYWNDEIGWVEDIAAATTFDSNNFSLPVANNIRFELVVYDSERSKWYRESDIKSIVRSPRLNQD